MTQLPLIKKKNRETKKTAFLTGIVVFGLLAQHQLKFTLKSTQATQEVMISHSADPEILKLFSFGFWPVLADWFWIKGLQDSELASQKSEDHSTAFYDFQNVIAFDPVFFEVYSSAAVLLAVVKNDGEGARKILERGERARLTEVPLFDDIFQNKFWPSSWRIPLYLGYVLAFEVGNIEQAAKAFEAASNVKDAPSFISRLAKKMQNPVQRVELEIQILTDILTREQDREVILRLKKKISFLKNQLSTMR